MISTTRAFLSCFITHSTTLYRRLTADKALIGNQKLANFGYGFCTGGYNDPKKSTERNFLIGLSSEQAVMTLVDKGKKKDEHIKKCCLKRNCNSINFITFCFHFVLQSDLFNF